MRLSKGAIIILILIPPVITIVISFQQQIEELAGPLLNNIIRFSGLIVPLITGLKLFLDWNNQPTLVYGGVYKKTEERQDPPTRISWKTIEQGKKYSETAYYLEVLNSKEKGRIENCEGYLTIDNLNRPTVWEGPLYSRYRHIGLRDNLKMFNISEDGKRLITFTNPNNIDGHINTSECDINEVLNMHISIKLGASTRNVPRRPFNMRINEVIGSAMDEV